MRLDKSEIALLLQGKEPTIAEVAKVAAQMKLSGRPAKLTGDDYIKAVKLKHFGYSGERVARIFQGIITSSQVNRIWREAKKDILESGQELSILD